MVAESALALPGPAANEALPGVAPCPEAAPSLPWPAVEELERRLGLYSDKLARWEDMGGQLAALDGGGQAPVGWTECRQTLEELVSGYRRLRDGLAAGKGEGGELWRINGQDLAFLEGDCPLLWRSGSEKLSAPRVALPPPPTPEEKGREMVKLVGLGRYQEALAEYENLRRTSPEAAALLAPRQAYGLALLHTGRVEGAIEVLAKELTPLEGDDQGGRWRQHQLVADLMVAAGRLAEAKAIYLRLADYFAAIERESLWIADQLAVLETPAKEIKSLVFYQSLLRNYLTGDGRRLPESLASGAARLETEFAASPLAHSGRALLKRAEEQVAVYVRRQIAVAANQVRDKAAKQAVATLSELQVGLPPDLSEAVQKALDEARQAEKSELETKTQGANQGQAQQWTEANHLLELRKYDEAILLFRALEGGDFGERAQAKLAEAANQAAVALRREAAVLFSKAAKIQDPGQQAEALQASRRLLEQLLAKYPQAEVIGKAKQNLKSIDEQLSRLLPAGVVPPSAGPGAGL